MERVRARSEFLVMAIALTFAPDRARAVFIDYQMRIKLTESLATIADEAKALKLPLSLDLDRVITSLRGSKPAAPALWGHYGDLCRAIALDDIEALRAACKYLREVAGLEEPGRLCNLTDEDLGPRAAALFAQTVNDDPGLPLNLGPVESKVVNRVAGELGSVLGLIAEASPQLAGEVDVFGRQIVLAEGAPGGAVFSGATTIFLWGAVLINPAEVRGRLQLFEALTHECAHALLTGMTGGVDVTENDPTERFKSPLRSDPRPMEGIAHATFVLARIVYVLDLLANTASLHDHEQTQVASMKAANLQHFRAGADVIQRSARLTREGKMIFDDCFGAMQRFV